MKKILNTLEFIIFSNILIALAAASQILLTYSVLQIPINWFVVVLEFSGTLLLYNFSLWLAMPSDSNDSPFRRTRWFFKYKRFIGLLSFTALLSLVYALTQLHAYTFLLLFLVGFLSLGYAIPIVRFQGKMISLRQILGAKVFLIAIVWALSTVGLPVVEYWSTGGVVSISAVLYWLGLVALFVLTITLPFDIRDIKQDRYYKLKTIPVLLGEQKSMVLCYVLIVIHMILILWDSNVLFRVKAGLVAVDLCVVYIFYALLFQRKASYNQVYLLDFILIVQFLVYLLFNTFQ